MSNALSEKQWTPEQLQSIRTAGTGLLVSAAAGSGKTAVLAERCVQMVCDADTPCEVDELLVVTFGEAAAAEMKSRIHERLRQRAENAPADTRLSQQLALIDQAQVSTLHSFCFRLLRRHFQIVGLDPAFTLLDEQESMLLRNEVAEKLFADRYADDPAGSFARFVDAYGEGNDTGLMGRVIAVHDLLQSVVKPAAWIDEHRRRLREAAEQPLKKSELGREFLDTIAADLTSVGLQGKQSVAELRGMREFAKLADYTEELVITLRQWWALRPKGLDALSAAVRDYEFRKAPPISKDAPGRERALALMERVRQPMKGGPIRRRMQFSEEHWRKGMAAIAPHAEVFFSLLEQFGERFAKAKSAERAVDFADLERLTLKVLRDGDGGELRPSAIARAHHEQFHHVLVDEYQDINEVQDAILHLLSRECLAEHGGRASNLFCVGDVKQSIYGFRLADVERFLERMEKYRSPAAGKKSLGRVIDLQTNFRSRSPLLSAINALFAKVMSQSAGNVDYDDTHKLSPGPQYPKQADESECFSGAPIELHLLTKPASAHSGDDEDSAELDRTEREAALVARRIGELLGRDGSPAKRVVEIGEDGVARARPIQLKDIAILLRSKKFKSEQFAAALQRAGIRAHAESATGFFETVEARDMIALLQLLDNQQQDVPMAAVLRSPLGGLPEPDECLAKIRAAYLHTEPAIAFHEAAVRYAAEQGDELAAHLQDFFELLTGWRTAARRRPLAELLRIVYDDSGYLAFCTGLEDGEQRAANLQFLHEQAAKFDTFHRQGLPRFLTFLKSLEDDSDLGSAPVASEADDVVRIMTIHRAKGLEFPVVIVPDIGKRINVQDCHGSLLVDRTHGLGLDVVDTEKFIRYRSLAGMLVEAQIRRRILAEELRVLYVAATRAREHLILIGTVGKSAWEEWQKQWADHDGVMPEDVVLSAGSMADWIGPAAACATIDDSTPAFDVIAYTPEESAEMDLSLSMRAGESADGKLAALADFAPLAPPPNAAAMAQAQAILDRVSWPYPFADAARRPAAKSVTAIAKSPPTAPPAPSIAPPTSDSPVPAGFARKLDRPMFLDPDAAPLATERGTATHVLLEHFDFRRPPTATEIERQIAELLAAKRITAQQAKMVDRDAVAWVLESQAGKLLHNHADRIRREIPVYFPLADATAGDGLDRTMIRGRLDVFIPAAPAPNADGAIIIDYKTDNVDATTIDARAELYAEQMKLYRQAMESITGQKVAKTLLVFLKPRIVLAVK